jgi:hypothetical protein
MDVDADTQRTDGQHPDASTPAELDLHGAAVVLGISPEAVRKRISRGTLPARKVAGVWMVTIIPDAPAWTNGRTDIHPIPGRATDRPRPSSPIDPTAYARAQERIAGLEAQLAQAREDRDRWYQQAVTAQEAYLRDMAAMRELVAREQAIALRATTSAPDAWTDNGRTGDTMDADGQPVTVQASGPEQEPPIGHNDHDKVNWRRWWRRMTGGA